MFFKLNRAGAPHTVPEEPGHQALKELPERLAPVFIDITFASVVPLTSPARESHPVGYRRIATHFSSWESLLGVGSVFGGYLGPAIILGVLQ